MAERKFGVTPYLFVRTFRIYIGVFAQVAARVSGALPCEVSPVRVLTSLLSSDRVVHSTPTPMQRMARLDPSRLRPVWKAIPPEEVGRCELTRAELAAAFDSL